MIENRKLEIGLFYALLIGTFALVVMIFLPFITPIILALLFAVLFNPLHKRISKKFSSTTISAALITFSSVLIIVLPIVYFATQITDELFSLYTHYISFANQNTVNNVIFNLNGLLGSINLDFINISEESIFKFFAMILDWIQSNITGFLASLAGFGVNLFLFLISTYYFLKDGKMFLEKVISLSPMSDDKDSAIIKRLNLAINSILKGRILISIIQGILVGFSFWLLGIPAPTIWGAVAILAALIPMVGTGIVVAPGVIYLLILNQAIPAVVLLIWGVLIVGLVDNVLGPKLLSKNVSVHPFFVLISVFGGLSFFGPLGFIFGPLTLSLLVALVDIYKSEIVK